MICLSDREAHNLAREFERIFREGGWEVTTKNAITFLPPAYGITIRMYASDAERNAGYIPNPPEGIHSIIEAFKSARISFKKEVASDVQRGQLVLVVGTKP